MPVGSNKSPWLKQHHKGEVMGNSGQNSLGALASSCRSHPLFQEADCLLGLRYGTLEKD